MAYYDSRHPEPRRHDSYYQRSRDASGYSRHASSSLNAHYTRLTAMRNSLNRGASSYSSADYDHRYAARPSQQPPPPLPKRSSAYSYRPNTRTPSRWPPSPSVEDEAASLAKEFPSPAGSEEEDSSGEAKARGSVDQYPIIEEIEQPNVASDSDDRRFVLVSDPSADGDSSATIRDRRRKSFAERGNMPYLKTDISDEPQLFPKRVSTPYSYTKPSKESTGPSAADYFLSPESITPGTSSIPRSVLNGGNHWESRDQNAKPSRNIHGRYDSVTQSPRAQKNDVFDDSDVEEDATRLRAERKPARYSFVKSDLQKEDLRTNILNSQPKSERRRDDQPSSQPSRRGPYESSSGSSKTASPMSQSSRSSSPHLSNSSSSRQKASSRPSPVETGYPKESRKVPEPRPSSPLPVRPSSPLAREHPPSPSPPRSPRLPPRRPADSPPSSRPVSRSGPRPTSHLAFSETISPPPTNRVPVSGAEWYATYPPTTVTDGARPSSRYTRHESMPVPMPRIDVQSPSPAPPPRTSNALPYPVDDRPIDAFMPPEEAYQFDHSLNSPAASSPFRSAFPDSPRVPQAPAMSSPRESLNNFRPPVSTRHTTTDETPRLHRVRSGSMRSQSSHDSNRRGERKQATFLLDRPLPSCPRSEPSAKNELWYTLENYPNFDICPTCYDGVFADTHFAPYFKLKKGYDRSIARFCDFSSPWMRLAWLLSVKQQRSKPDLLWSLARIVENEKPCPRDRELTNGLWYGIPDPRDGLHITNFTICPCDMRHLEALFPSIRGYFTRVPPSDYRMPSKQACTVRVTSRRFPKYLDLLVELDEEATQRKRPVNFEPFLQLARANAYKRECQKDKQLFTQAWHFIPQLPEFAVCEECYEEVVQPAVQDRSKVASMFNRTAQFVPNENLTDGSTCCLYSKRMRRVWERALQDDDFKYLKRKALERKEEELRLSEEKRRLEAYAKRADMYLKGTADYDKLMRKIADVEDEWKEWE